MSQPTKRKSRTTNPIGGKNMFGKGRFGGGMIFKTLAIGFLLLAINAATT